jgi:hypothetical protein
LFEVTCRSKEFEIIVAKSLRRKAYVFLNRKMGEDIGDLEGTADAQMSSLMLGNISNIISLIDYLPPTRLEIAAEKIKKGCFTRAIWPDDRVQRSGSNLNADIIDSDQGAKLTPQIVGF